MSSDAVTLREWYEAQRLWPSQPDAPAKYTVSPTVAEAGGACVLEFAIEATENLAPGARLCVEYPYGWGKWLGRCYGSKGVEPRSRGMAPGMGLLLDVTGLGGGSWDDHTQVCDVDRFLVIVVTVPGPGLPAGERVGMLIGAPPGAPARAQKWAERAVFTSGVDRGDGVILPVRPQPTVQVVGGPADRLSIYAPATPTPGEPFPVRIEARDRVYENPAQHEGAAALHWQGGLSGPDTATINGDPAEAAGNAMGWVTACDADAALAGRSDPIGPGFLEGGNRVFFGDIHGQVHDSIGTGTHEEYFEWARDVEHLDFCSPANHYGGRTEADDRTWRRCVDATNAYDEPGRFVTLVAYECGSADGHRNVYYRGDSGELFLHGGYTNPGARVMPELVERLREVGRDVYIVPHHPNFCSPVDWSKDGRPYQRLVEICSQWGISEEGPAHSVQAALTLGHRLGFIGGSDTHMGTPGRAHQDWGQPCSLAAVVAPELTREAIWQALHDRRCYAVFGERILLDFSVSGHAMGEEVSVDGDRVLQAKVATRTPIEALEVVRNGEVVKRFPDAVGERLAEVTWTDDEPLDGLLMQPAFEGLSPFCYYYVRVRTVTGNRAWSSPVWVGGRNQEPGDRSQ